MARKVTPNRDFFERDEFERHDLLASVWCDTCGESNLGVEEPTEHEEQGFVLLEGKCAQCGDEIVARIEQLVED